MSSIKAIVKHSTSVSRLEFLFVTCPTDNSKRYKMPKSHQQINCPLEKGFKIMSSSSIKFRTYTKPFKGNPYLNRWKMRM